GAGPARRVPRRPRARAGRAHDSHPRRARLRDRPTEHPRHRGRSRRRSDHGRTGRRSLRRDGRRVARHMKVLIIGSGPILIGEPVPESITAHSVEEALAFAARVGYPLVIRPAFTLGGTGGGVANDAAELTARVTSGVAASPIGQVLVERSLLGWKEIEYEVMRDGGDTCIAVCNMENVDPMGVHTGDSIVVAPSQTLTDKAYQMLR